jgi:hypothetical protein
MIASWDVGPEGRCVCDLKPFPAIVNPKRVIRKRILAVFNPFGFIFLISTYLLM